LNKVDENFIREAFAGREQDDSINNEIGDIKDEIQNNKIDTITAEWVKEWHEKQMENTAMDTKKREIRDFIASSLEDEKGKPVIRIVSDRKKEVRRKILRYVSLAAAAIISVVILFRTLLPSYNPEKLFSTYYEPLNVISPVTRNSNTNLSNGYNSAIEMYRLGNYQGAAIGFSDAIEKDNSSIEPLFFMGITELALENYDQAINMLSDATNPSINYWKEAEWYLGLAYLKTGEKEKAFTCFEILSQTEGFYHKRAEAILRHLK
jgi:tetratricopeptide (TPR) repeat protein